MIQGSAAALPAPPAPGETVEIRPGLLWVRLPIEGPPWHVNCWLLADGDGWMVIDAGHARDSNRLIWEGIFARALGGKPITRVLITHFHSDHVGLAGWMCRHWGAPLLMPRIEFIQSRLLMLEAPSELIERQAAFGEAAGAPADYLAHLLRRKPFYRPDVEALPTAHRGLRPGHTLSIGGREWALHEGRGHAPGMVMLHAPDLGVLIAADQVLPRISPYIGVFPEEPEGDPLGAFLESNRALLGLPEETLVLPSHGEPFLGLHHRLRWLSQHHAERLALLEAACVEPRTAYDAARLMFTRDFDHDQITFVIGEGIAHINWLVARGRLAREHGADGLVRYRSAR